MCSCLFLFKNELQKILQRKGHRSEYEKLKRPKDDRRDHIENHVAIVQEQQQQQYVHLNVDSVNSSFEWRWMCLEADTLFYSIENWVKMQASKQTNKRTSGKWAAGWDIERTRKVTICVYLRLRMKSWMGGDTRAISHHMTWFDHKVQRIHSCKANRLNEKPNCT